ncbi:MAG: iron-sulfur cluster assembly scaffold protein [Dehalococcoidia bacterium]
MEAGYSETTLDHYEAPRNRGSTTQPDAVAFSLNPVCGDTLRLFLSLRDGRIEKASFEAEGCVAAVAAGSITTELVQGLAVEEAASIDREKIETALGGLPPSRAHGPALAAHVLGLALSQLAQEGRAAELT